MVDKAQDPMDFVGVGNGGEQVLSGSLPYRVEVEVTGVCPILFRRYDVDEVKAKAEAAKGSAEKKKDNPETAVWRCANGNLGIPGVYLVGTLTNKATGAAKYRQDPRSPRKSALDLWKAGVVPLTILADTGKPTWDFEDRRRVVVQGAVTRTRPGLHAGYKAVFHLMVTVPEYISPTDLHESLNLGGRLGGLGDFRPTFGRFQVTRFRVLGDNEDVITAD